jgi:hypothetical protein
MTDLSTDSSESRSVPSVSRERWRAHALTKLGKGYRLIVGDRKSANFHHPNHGYETCSHEAARKLIQDGSVVPVGEHRLGTIYALPILASADERPPAAPRSRSRADDDDLDEEYAPLDLSDFGAELDETDPLD